jgi:hypothetical protein
MNRTTASAMAAVGLLAAALFALLAVAERAGLPLFWVKAFLCATGALTLLCAVVLARTTQERAFFAAEPMLGPVSGGLALAMLVVTVNGVLLPATDGAGWLAVVLGAPVGLLAGHGVSRAARKIAGRRDLQPRLRALPAQEVMRGAALALAGVAVLLAGADLARGEAAAVFGLSPAAASMLSLAAVLAAVLLGGGAGASLLLASLAGFAVLCMVINLAAGFAAFGNPALPGWSEPQTLAAISEARTTWGVGAPIHLTEWPALASVLEGDALRRLLLSALTAAGLSLALSPGLPAHRRGHVAVAAGAALLLPIALVAIAGYAIEAAAIRFIGAPVVRPPPGLVEAAQFGLVTVCGASPDTADAVRIACGVAPRDPALLAWRQIALSSAYVHGGPTVALGYTATVGLAVGIGRLAMALIAATAGLWLLAEGLGRDLLARNRAAAGLASLRLGLARLAAVLAAIGAMILGASGVALSPPLLLVALGLGSGLLLLIGMSRAFRRPASVITTPPPPRRRKAPSAQGEPA